MRSVPFHYGWVILLSGELGSFMTTPGQTYGVAPFFDPVARDLGLSRAAVATAYTIGTLAGVLPAPLIGRWIDRRGPDWRERKKRGLDLQLPAAEIRKRLKKWRAPKLRYTKGVFHKYAVTVSNASEGAITD